MSERTNIVKLCEVPEMIAELTAAVCLAGLVDEPDENATREGRELANSIRRIRRDLEAFLTDDVRDDLAALLRYIDSNRDRYRQAVLLWVDLLEEIAALMEREYGDKTGALKNSEVRAAVYYLMKAFIGDQPLPHVPPFLRPIALELAIRGTIEFLVTLDNAPDTNRPQLWDNLGPPRVARTRMLRSKVSFRGWKSKWLEKLGTWIVGWFLKPPKLSGELRLKVDLIIAGWQERNRLTNTTPVERTVGTVFQTAIWIGNHADEIRALIDLVSVAVLEAAKLSQLTRRQRIAVVKEAVVDLIQEDLGFRGPLWGTIMRIMVDLLADAIEDLFRKRGLMSP